ncbi:MAG: UDP-N-acetylglucosamine--N-acetylmuramyl-(pentapeptide) pyrophosphoryl-undecaprenol N-acetylglucosamine transferase, partial [Muribaculaceae bacterium]|nr:UDP-N-acetylglucosamine--N-acetylmuramyl-(pentapeptide) pyrophosphoryl-undecaprenol N-acetylglucosamine transferase [Muribaculaceae bacterium]
EKHIGTLTAHGLQVIWQTGKNFGNRGIKAAKGLKGVVVTEFLNDMGTAYAAATLVVSRAGAGAISELELLGKPVVLVPSPNVAEDHQTKNARALSDKGAAILVPDDECHHILPGVLISLARDKQRLQSMSNAISAMARHDSDKLIANEVKRIVTSHNPEIQL